MKYANRWTVLPLLALVLTGGTVRADYLDRALLDEALKVRESLLALKHHTIGVLKFRFEKPGEEPTFNAGPINANLADRLESALLRYRDSEYPFEILQEFNKQARGMIKVKHGTPFDFYSNPRDREALFDLKFLLDVPAQKPRHVKPDALLTGDVILSKDNRTALIQIKAFDTRMAKEPRPLHKFEIRTDRNFLADCGENYVVKRTSLARDPRDVDQEAAGNATKHQESKVSIMRDPDNPIELTILYNGDPVEIKPDPSSPGGEMMKTAEPKQRDKVTFKIKNRSKDQVGVVLAVNGKNTLMEEDVSARAPSECTKWILDPDGEIAIPGFYTQEDGKNLKPFRVLGDEESEKKMLEPHVKGMISAYVFMKNPGVVSADHLKSEARRTNLRRTLRKQGLIFEEEMLVPGDKLQRVKFEHDREPVASLNIRYYTGK
jgi:hypothetical protein